jgi:hypothetical protein
MVLLGDEAQVEAHFGPFGDSANLDARLVHNLHRMYHRLENHFACTRWNSNMMWVTWNLILVHLDARLVHGLRQTYLRLRIHFGRARWYSYVTRLN